MSAPTSVPTTEYKPIMGGNWQAEGACQECSTGSTGGICTHEILTGYCCRTTSRPWAFRATEWKAHCVNKPQQQTLAKQVSRRFKRAWERKRERERTWEKKKDCIVSPSQTSQITDWGILRVIFWICFCHFERPSHPASSPQIQGRFQQHLWALDPEKYLQSFTNALSNNDENTHG